MSEKSSSTWKFWLIFWILAPFVNACEERRELESAFPLAKHRTLERCEICDRNNATHSARLSYQPTGWDLIPPREEEVIHLCDVCLREKKYELYRVVRLSRSFAFVAAASLILIGLAKAFARHRANKTG